MRMQTLQLFWTWGYIIGLGAFAVVAIGVIPWGARDLVRLLKELGEEQPSEPGR